MFLELMTKQNLFDDFKKCVYNQFHHKDHVIIGVLNINPSSNYSLSILKNMRYYNTRSGSLFNFYIPGYNPNKPWAILENDIYKDYNASAHSDFIEQLELNLSNYNYSGKIELLLLDVEKGHINTEHYILLFPHEMELYGKAEFSVLFENIYKGIKYLSITDLSKLKRRFRQKILEKSILDCLYIILRKTKILKHLIKQSRGIKFV